MHKSSWSWDAEADAGHPAQEAGEAACTSKHGCCGAGAKAGHAAEEAAAREANRGSASKLEEQAGPIRLLMSCLSTCSAGAGAIADHAAEKAAADKLVAAKRVDAAPEEQEGVTIIVLV